MTDVSLPTPSLATELARRSRTRDVGLLLAVPAVLVLAWVAGEPVRSALVLRPEQPTAVTVVTAHFVHASADHLLGNLAVYAGAVSIGYPLAVLGGSRQRYVTMVVGVLLAVPPVVSGFHLLVLGPGVLLGASAISLALVGTLPVVLVEFLRARVIPADAAGVIGFFLLGFATVGWPAASTIPNGRWLFAGVGLVGLIVLVPIARARWRHRDAGVPIGAGPSLGTTAVAAVCLLFLAVAGGLRSPAGLSAGTLHLLAYVSGFVGAYGTTGYLRLRPRPAPPPDAG